MDFENDSNVSPQHAPVGKAKNRTAWRVLYGLFFGLSVVANIVLLLVVVGLAAVFATGQGDVFAEAVLEEGPKTQKIAVISIEGLIDSEKAMDFASQLKRTRKDKHIKGLIIRVNSPGGTISASDRIYNQIQRYRQQTNLPVVAFMQAVAASGGYYTIYAGCCRIGWLLYFCRL
jgi:protease-4